MKEYKSIERFLNKNKKEKKKSCFINKLLIFIVVVLGTLIFIKFDNGNKKIVSNFLYKNNINFAGINNLYKKYLGNILPFEKIISEPISQVFNEEISYNKLNKYQEGICLEVSDNYLVPTLESGIVVFIGEKENYGNTVIIQQADKTEVWYGNMNNVSVNVYDYIGKGNYLGEINDNKLYLLFQRDGKNIDYKQYIK